MILPSDLVIVLYNLMLYTLTMLLFINNWMVLYRVICKWYWNDRCELISI